MQRVLGWILVVSLAAGIFAPPALGATSQESKRVAKLKSQCEGLPEGAALRVTLKDHREMDGEMAARSEDGFEINAPQPVTVRYSEVEAIREWDGQGNAGASSQRSSHRHRIVKYIVIFAVAFGLTVALASLDK